MAALLAMPAAKGLFHRAIAMSGALVSGVPKARATQTAVRFMTAAGARNVDELQRRRSADGKSAVVADVDRFPPILPPFAPDKSGHLLEDVHIRYDG